MLPGNGAARSWTKWRLLTSCRGCWTGCGVSDLLPQVNEVLPPTHLRALPSLPISRALMTSAAHADPILQTSHLLGIETLSVPEISALLDLAETYVTLNRSAEKKTAVLRGRTLINLFFESSTRTQSSFELAGKRLGADVMNMSVKTSSVSKGETLIDTATTLNAMRPDM